MTVIAGTNTDSDVEVINTTTYDGDTSLKVTPGRSQIYHVFLEADALAATKAYMLVDLSDTTNWPHTNAGHIHIHHVFLNVAPTKMAQIDIELGFLSNVGATDGDFNKLHAWKMGNVGKEERFLATDILTFPYGGIECQTANWFGPVRADDAAFQTDVNLTGPDGATEYPSGNGDLVLYVIVGAETVDFAVHIGYITD